MAAPLYIVSAEKGAGKTTVGAGLGKYWLDSGKKVGFIKFLSSNATDADAVFMKEILALEETIECICPVVSNQNLESEVKAAYGVVAAGKDVVIIEDGMSGLDARQIAAVLGARVAIVISYPQKLSVDSGKGWGESLLGVVLNKVPLSQLKSVSQESSSQLGKSGTDLLGVLPEDRVLLALTVDELTKHLQGEILDSGEKLGELVENFMLGALSIDHGPEYFNRKNNKAVVLRSDRPDMQLAALETATKCLVLSGDTAPVSVVLHRAKVKQVPIILIKGKVPDAVPSIEDALPQSRFRQARKLPRLAELMPRHFNLQLINQKLGLAK